MSTQVTERKGPLFNENVVLDGGVIGQVVGNLGRRRATLIEGGIEKRGTMKLIPTQEAGRLTRSWMIELDGGRKVFVAEEGLSAGRKI